ncbi:hypothetical protein FB451DRAFT_1261194, partial [Mycena latifolia]
MARSDDDSFSGSGDELVSPVKDNRFLDPWHHLRTTRMESAHKLLVGANSITKSDPHVIKKLLDNCLPDVTRHAKEWQQREMPLEVERYLYPFFKMVDKCADAKLIDKKTMKAWEACLPDGGTEDEVVPAAQRLPKNFLLPEESEFVKPDDESSSDESSVVPPVREKGKGKANASGRKLIVKAEKDDTAMDVDGPPRKRKREVSPLPSTPTVASSSRSTRNSSKKKPAAATKTKPSQDLKFTPRLSKASPTVQSTDLVIPAGVHPLVFVDEYIAKDLLNEVIKASDKRQKREIRQLSLTTHGDPIPQDLLLPVKRPVRNPLDGAGRYPSKAVVYWSHLPAIGEEPPKNTLFGPRVQRYLAVPKLDPTPVTKELLRPLDHPDYGCFGCIANQKECGPWIGLGAPCEACNRSHGRCCTQTQTPEQFDFTVNEASKFFSLGSGFQRYMYDDLIDASVRAINAQRTATFESSHFADKLALFIAHSAEIVDFIGPDAFTKRFQEALPDDPHFTPIVDRINEVTDKFNELNLEQFKTWAALEAKRSRSSSVPKDAGSGDG